MFDYTGLIARQDSTLISTSSGNVFAKDATDWKWWHVSVPSTLRQLHADGYLIAILSNQGSIGLKSDPKSVKSDQKSLSNFKSKANSVFNQLDIPIVLLAASARDQYRKPRTGMWTELLEELDLDGEDGPDLAASFFVGDAGGRAARSGDNTNADGETRAIWIQLGRKFNVPVRCVYFTAPPKLCEHNDTVRAIAGEKFNPEKRMILPHTAFSSFASRFKQPKADEGFEDVVRVDFQFQGDGEQRKLWSRYWI
ncbi:MAG: hypothetical protein Q9201_007155 [Fulgogasparrea decipioides]